MTATMLQTIQPTAPVTISLREAIDDWAQRLMITQLTVDQLAPGDVLSGLQDIRIDARTRELPKSLSALLADVKSRIKEIEKGRSAINFNIKGLLRTLDEGVAQLS